MFCKSCGDPATHLFTSKFVVDVPQCSRCAHWLAGTVLVDLAGLGPAGTIRLIEPESADERAAYSEAMEANW